MLLASRAEVQSKSDSVVRPTGERQNLVIVQVLPNMKLYGDYELVSCRIREVVGGRAGS